VELLVVIAVIAVLIGLLVPAVHSVRESARRTHCKGNLREIALGCRNFASQHGVLPYSGWTAGWVGDPDKAVDNQQNGGTFYHILPFIERTTLWEMGTGLTGAAKNAAFGVRAGTSVPTYTCPGRGSALFTGYKGLNNASFVTGASIARTDYAGCWSAASWSGGGALDTRNWITGGMDLESIIDGLSNVFLCGERYLAPEQYRPTVWNAADASRVGCNNAGWSVGFEGDIASSVLNSAGNPNPPLRDTTGVSRCWANATTGAQDERYGGGFGGPHDVVIMAMCDGSVRGVSYTVDPTLFKQIGTVGDGGAADRLD
jgi:type II secretory pathway pseudopilin PulG